VASALFVDEEPSAGQRLRGSLVLAGALDILGAAGLAARGQLAAGEVLAAILRQAEASKADMIVAGSRGLGAVWDRLLGSVTRRLVRQAGRSVLIVRPEA
jgi:nucleotide-binding universal stress UspA family protein